jgi:hypothetical protein
MSYDTFFLFNYFGTVRQLLSLSVFRSIKKGSRMAALF